MGASVSILLPVYNGEAFLPACVESLLAQTFSDFELILLDDGSADGTAALCDAYAARDPRVRALHRPNGGLASGRNALIAAARGRWLTFVDADDWVEADYLAYLLRLCEAHGARMAACNHLIEENTGPRPCFAPGDGETLLTARDACRGLLYHRPPDVSAWGKLYRRDVFDGLSYPDGRLFEDSHLIAALLRQAGGIAMGFVPKYHYRYVDTSISKQVAPARLWDYMDAVDHMTDEILADYPDLTRGSARRRAHAALSTKRLRVLDTPRPDFTRANRVIRQNALRVLGDAQAPARDKLGILAACLGDGAYRRAWALYERARGRG